MRLRKFFIIFCFLFLIIFLSCYTNISSASELPFINDGSVYLMDSRTTKPLYSKDENSKIAITLKSPKQWLDKTINNLT